MYILHLELIKLTNIDKTLTAGDDKMQEGFNQSNPLITHSIRTCPPTLGNLKCVPTIMFSFRIIHSCMYTADII